MSKWVNEADAIRVIREKDANWARFLGILAKIGKNFGSQCHTGGTLREKMFAFYYLPAFKLGLSV